MIHQWHEEKKIGQRTIWIELFKRNKREARHRREIDSLIWGNVTPEKEKKEKEKIKKKVFK